ncbi:MAG TPA: succinyl-diaminopimelate desuccinylase [Candidatus Cybelea sp.]|nr:succinyl-diaminopimelate desuccinylase [Candidatus Cybelea sp.]
MDAKAAIDTLALSRAMIRCPSVTPADAGALDVLQAALEGIGFRCRRLKFSAPDTPDIDNLYARYGSAEPNFCFAGHSDVVPAGDRARWSVDPFAAVVRDGQLVGRGAADMKSAIACFVTAAQRVIAARGGKVPGSISLLITGDEEGPAVNGTAKVLQWMAAHGERIDACVVGEPTNPTRLGEMVKIGRRGSLTGRLTVLGAQGHVAYPHLADNPIPRLMRVLSELDARELDKGNAHFQASNLEVTTIDVGNPANNVIPAAAKAVFNIRYNTEQTAASLEAWIRDVCARLGGAHELAVEHGSNPFLTVPGRLTDTLVAAIADVTGTAPELSTTGGTSDARFIKDYCPVAEFGLVGQTMHKVDEHTAVADLARLADIYTRLLERWFAD